MWMSFIKAIFKGEFKLSPWTYAGFVAAAVTLALPVDAVPELILGPLGFVDDLGLTGVFLALMNWERGRYERELMESSIPPAATHEQGE